MKKLENIFIGLVILVIAGATIVNLKISERRSRDAQRKSDIRSVSDALLEYNNDFAFYPLSENGNIVACNCQINKELKIFEFQSCKWGESGLYDPSDPNYPAYIKALPLDPHSKDGVGYYYISNGRHFQLYASLEGRDEAEFDEKIEKLNYSCGNKICNFGLSDSKTPVNKTLEQYEEELKNKN
jgi:hypothetical protein